MTWEQYEKNLSVPEYDFRYAFDFRRRPMRYVYHIWRDNLFSDLFFRLSGRKTEK